MRYILVLEDEAIIAWFLAKKLENMVDEPVIICSNQRQAFDRASEGLPVLAFLDVNLGDETCFDIAIWLRERSVPVFFLTAYSPESLRKIGLPKDLEGVVTVSKSAAFPTLADIVKTVNNSKLPDRDAARSPHPPLPHSGSRKRQLSLQGQLRDGEKETKGDTSIDDTITRRT